MGRLQRKKTPSTKKKKKQDSGIGTLPPKKDQPALKTGVLFSGISKKSVTKQTPSSKLFASKRKVEPGKVKAFLDTSVQFLREVKVELKKVVWPSRKQTLGSTVVVLILVFIISFFLGAVDIGLSSIIRIVLQ
ncbi:MAG: preprotein translocase subunit SecE [Deltaproteobacteria bacterium]|nr:preprotein translocase subunit SecE [Deltaproteobacteria bacterium]